MSDEIKITDNEFLRQFETTIDEELATIEYSQQERKIFLTKVLMSENLRNDGYLEPFIETVLKEIKERNTRVMPTSPEIAKFMRRNRRKYKDLLPVGINI
ncbi:N-acetyltransferase [Zunongwangia sp. F363]|uniref:N-acetyltransferase n=1 Tax=Autumnicola tepida TaxID=3075595 RepID=A0ABU3CB66_9FLAO|nr:N-acetyltransferase [Zunongwangia sp. F363]MDT0643285.1 N-acetyltransferase [Zunongwangia sp. F363]